LEYAEAGEGAEIGATMSTVKFAFFGVIILFLMLLLLLAWCKGVAVIIIIVIVVVIEFDVVIVVIAGRWRCSTNIGVIVRWVVVQR
jgi:hypothetical protein